MRARMDPATAVRRLVPPERLTSRVTDLDDAFVIGHFGLAVEEPDRPVVVDGLVATATHLTPDDVRALPAHRVESVHECFGNPLEPGVPVRRVANLVWTGARLRDVLALAAPRDRADTLWARGADHGEFGGIAADDYLKDLPLDDVLDRALVAYAVDDAPLATDRGGPLRLVVPGYFGTNSVKWLSALTLADHRPEHLFTTRLYQRPGPDGDPVPVRALDVNCAITTPAADAVVERLRGRARRPRLGVERRAGHRRAAHRRRHTDSRRSRAPGDGREVVAGLPREPSRSNRASTSSPPPRPTPPGGCSRSPEHGTRRTW